MRLGTQRPGAKRTRNRRTAVSLCGNYAARTHGFPARRASTLPQIYRARLDRRVYEELYSYCPYHQRVYGAAQPGAETILGSASGQGAGPLLRRRKRSGRFVCATNQTLQRTPSGQHDSLRLSRVSSRGRAAVWGRELESLLASRDTILFLIDSDGFIRDVQVHDPRQIRSLTSLLIGRTMDDVFEQEVRSLLAVASGQAKSSGKAEEFGCSFAVGGKERWLRVTVRSAEKAEPPANLLHVVFRDPSLRAGLRVLPGENDATLRRVTDSAQVVTWQADLRAGCLTCSERLAQMLHAREDDAVVRDFLWDAMGGWFENRSAGDAANGKEAFEQDVEISRPHGSPCVLCLRTVAEPEEAGLPVRFAGVVEDVTAIRAMDALVQKQGALLAAAEQVANLGRWELDLQSGKMAWSSALYELLDLPLSREANEQAYWKNLHPEDRARIRSVLAQAIRNGQDCAYIARYRTPQGEWRVHETRVLPVQSSAGALTHLVGVVRDISEQTRAEEELHRLTQRLMRARDEERRHMARELHESAGQSLAALKMSLGNLRESLSKRNAGALSLLESCVQLADEAVREVRTVSYLMHPPMLDEAGLASALRWYARGFSERSKIEVAVDVAEDFGRLPQELEMTIFRLVQEALTNVHRYSGSRTARIRLARENCEIRAEVIDAGCGLARPLRPNSGATDGVGIAGMRERVHELGGIFEIETAPGRGTTIRAVFPDPKAVAGSGTFRAGTPETMDRKSVENALGVQARREVNNGQHKQESASEQRSKWG